MVKIPENIKIVKSFAPKCKPSKCGRYAKLNGWSKTVVWFAETPEGAPISLGHFSKKELILWLKQNNFI